MHRARETVLHIVVLRRKQLQRERVALEMHRMAAVHVSHLSNIMQCHLSYTIDLLLLIFCYCLFTLKQILFFFSMLKFFRI